MTSVSAPNAAASGTFMLGGDLPVHRLGFGAMRITGDGIWGPPAHHDEAIATLRRAVALGINLIDTADAYGPEVSENLIAEALHPYPAGLVIATKGGLVRPGPDSWDPDGRPEHLRQALDGSLRRLRLERIDLYQFHRPDPHVPFAESVGTLADLRRQGKIRHIGLSNVTTEQLRQAQRIVPIASVQNRYNLTDRDSEDVLSVCEQQNIGFIPWFPLATGDLARQGSAVEQSARRHNTAPSQIALAWLLRRSPVMLPIPGTSTRKHLEENVAAAGITLSQDEFNDLGRVASKYPRSFGVSSGPHIVEGQGSRHITVRRSRRQQFCHLTACRVPRTLVAHESMHILRTSRWGSSESRWSRGSAGGRKEGTPWQHVS